MALLLMQREGSFTLTFVLSRLTLWFGGARGGWSAVLSVEEERTVLTPVNSVCFPKNLRLLLRMLSV